MNFLSSLRSEAFKTRRTASRYLPIIAGACIPAIILLEILTDGLDEGIRPDPLNSLYIDSFQPLGILIFPMFVILIATLLAQVEYRNNTWKQVFASPQRMDQIYLAKFLNLQILILAFLLSYNLWMVLALVFIHFWDPSLNLLNSGLDWKALVGTNLNTYTAVLAISALQFWMGLRFRNFIVPIAIGFGLWVVASMMTMEMHLEGARYFPYAFSIYAISTKFREILPSIQLWSVGYAVVFLLLGFLDFRRRKARG